MWQDHEVEGLVRENEELRRELAEERALLKRIGSPRMFTYFARTIELTLDIEVWRQLRTAIQRSGDYRANAETEAAAPGTAEKPRSGD